MESIIKRYLIIIQLSLVASVLCLTVASLQTYAEITAVGLKAGFSRTGVEGNIHDPDFACKLEHHYRNGFSLGLFGQYTITDRFFIQPELLFSKRGCDTDFIPWNSTAPLPSKYHHIFNYFDLPVLVKYRIFASRDYFQPNIFLGPCLSYFINYYMEGYGGPGADFNDYEETHLLNRWEFSAIIGAGFDYKRLTVDLRYHHAFTEMRKHLDAKNRVYSLMLGYKI